MRGAGQPIQKAKQDCGKRPFLLDFFGEPGGCGDVAQSGSGAPPHWNVMSRHLEMSEPRPEEMMMQPRTFCAVTSAAHTE